METASIRIKFTPLLNNALKNGSKCCLEIVPEVSCVQNLDKISWKQEKDMIEYTIPMTYKIILKKQEIVKETNDDLAVDVVEMDKTYHSCVDLLPPSSMTTLDLASGDVIRMISDTYILSKISAKTYGDKTVINDNPSNAIKAHVTEIQPNDCLKELPFLNHIIHEQTVYHDERKDLKNENAHHIPVDRSDFVDEYSLDKITNTDNILTVCKVTGTPSVETVTEISTRSRDVSKRKLSLSPICSIDTNDNPFLKTDREEPLNLVVDHVFQYETKDFDGNVGFKLPNRNEKYFNIKTLHSGDISSIENLYKARKLELPEARVAKFIKKMETEIMPLKIMLNDILKKCSTLELYKTKCIARNLILYKNLPSCKNQVGKYCKTEKQSKSNRVVYSIVFDG